MFRNKKQLFQELQWRFKDGDNADGNSDGDDGGGEAGNGGGSVSVEEFNKVKSANSDLLGQVGAMQGKIDELLTESKNAKKKAREAEEEARQKAEESAKQNGDIEALEKSWQEKYDRRVNELETKYASENKLLNSLLQSATVEATATKIATEIGVPGSTKALLPHIQSRLALEIVDGNTKVAVRGVDGKPSALTIDELKQEFINDEAFAPLIVGSKASGGGANGSSGGAGKGKTMKRTAFDDLSSVERREFIGKGGTIVD